jgi:hypothetical protein
VEKARNRLVSIYSDEMDNICDYTREYAAAMRVLEICTRKCGFVIVEHTPAGESTLDRRLGHWNVGKMAGGLWDSDMVANGRTLMEAICLFSTKVFCPDCGAFMKEGICQNHGCDPIRIRRPKSVLKSKHIKTTTRGRS